MKLALGTLKRGALGLAFGAALLVGAGATANAQHGSYGGYQNNGHAQRDAQHERRDVRREPNHQRDHRNNSYYNWGGYNNNNGYYNNGYNNGYYNQRGRGYDNHGWGVTRRDRHHR